MPFNRFILIIALVKAATSSVGESGVILSGNHEPVPFASIQNHRTGAWSISNENGVFWIPNGTVNGDSLHIERIGMKNKIFVFSEEFLAVHLEKDPIHFPEITIQNNYIHHLKKPLTGSTRNELVNSLSGSILRSYGGSAGIAQAAVDGGRTVDVKVIFNNIDLTSPQLGMTDLSQIPSQLLGNSTLFPNEHLKYGSGTTDGVIQLNPWSHPTGIQFQTSNDKSLSLSLHFSKETHNNILNVVAGENSDPGTHPVFYDGEFISRDNQYFGQQFGGIRHQYKFNSIWHSDLSFWHSIQDRGINGLIWSPNSEAFRKDTLSLFSGSMVRLFPKGFLKSSVAYRESGENYVDPTLSIDSDHFSSSLAVKLAGFYSFNSKFTFRLISGFAQEKINSTNAGSHNRERFFFAPSMSISQFAEFDFLTALRFNLYSDFGSALNYSVQIKRRIFSNMDLSASTGSSFRAPTFNDLYWNPGGNPNLNPERSFFRKFSTQFNFLKLSIEIFSKSKSSKDLIVWTSTGDFWQPENVDESSRQIIGFNGQLNISDGLFLYGALSYIKSENISTGNPLRYSPEWIGNVSTRIIKWDWVGNISLHFTGKQIVMYDFPYNLELDPTLTSHTSITSPKFFHNQLNFMMHISNLFNQEIMTIYGYPEPSRTIRINMSYQLNKKENK